MHSSVTEPLLSETWRIQDVGDSLPGTWPSSLHSTAEVSIGPPEPSTNARSLHNPNGAQSLPVEASGHDGVSTQFDSYVPVGVLSKRTTPEGTYPESEIALLEKHRRICTSIGHGSSVLVYILPDDVNRKSIPPSSNKLRNALKVVMSMIDPSPEAWEGRSPAHAQAAKESDVSEDESLWYIFNTLQNPDPQVEAMKDSYSRQAMEELLSSPEHSVSGLTTALYPFQRRSAAIMVQREAQPAQVLDPRLQTWKSPTGQEYYYDKEEGSIVREKRLYSEACGGILSEIMGCGKTLICLAVILATRGHFPKIPIKYQATGIHSAREKTGTLMEMAAAAAGRLSVPWKSYFHARREQGQCYDRCVKACEFHCGSYEIPPHQTKYQGRHSTSYPRPPAKRIRLCSGTLIVVPPNLVDHWERQIAQHTEGLKVLVLRQGSDVTPSADQLLDYDIVLFSKTRFEREAGEPTNNRRDRLVQVNSPLTRLHWLRVIVDEGHNVAGHGSKTNMVHLLNNLHLERRWIISGTPSSGLYGVEVSLASQEANTSDTESTEDMVAAALQGRKKTGNAVDNEMNDLARLRRIVIEFLDLKPWSNSRAEDPADWTTYIKPIGKDGKRRKAPSLRATLQSLIVRHRLDVVEAEITLPKLHNRVVFLEPTFYDRMSINLFLFGLAVNSITSERQGPDYMFDQSNRKHLNQTINNLRQAGFWWAGSDVDVQDTVDHALKYMNANREKMAPADIDQLNHGIQIARKAIDSQSWHGFKHLHELGVFVEQFPDHARGLWALDSANAQVEPLMLGITQARHAQQFITQHLRAYDPAEGLAGAGIKVRRELAQRDQHAAPRGAPESASAPSSKGQLVHSPKPHSNKSPKKTFQKNHYRSLPADSPLKQTQFVATTSAKLTYLLDQIVEHHTAEKIIIFYDNNNSAFWIAEGLELLGIEFRIYASTLKPELRTEYLKLFHESGKVRVLLMDLRQASHGLHLAQASRVFIVNPIWQPNVESQAIKRAHRIGQTRPVYVETLVLRDTLEDRMLRRRKEMSQAEMQQAAKSLLDDTTMNDIIQKEPFLAMPDELGAGAAMLSHPTGFFDRHRLPIPDDEVVSTRSPSRRKHPRVLGSDADDESAVDAEAVSPPPKRPRVGFGSSVTIVENGGLGAAPSVPSPLPAPAPVSAHARSSDTNGGTERRVSLFGP